MESNKKAELEPVTMFLDGVCSLCSREATYIEKHCNKDSVNFIDISDPDFKASQYGLNEKWVQKYLHVKLPNGEVRVGMDALYEVWTRVPNLVWLARVSRWPVIKQIFRIEYWIFARIRHWFPKRKESVVCDLKNRK
ncbi:MAG: DUF393 domain-containing protein [Bdellovibrionales bacterium]|nr:DUF393 domain-containing protein [Bdellovibrionales bacterium]